ncbi:MAG: phosphatase PAP2 family protein [Acidimicrobiales bacterium]
MPDAMPASVGDDAPNARIRPRWWTQVVLIIAVWCAYDAVNNLNPLRAATAFAHGVAIMHVETVMHLDPERWLNRWLGAHLVIGRWLGDYYDIAHFAVTIVVLVFVWWRHPRRYRRLRNALLGINLIGFVVFWAFPVAPPRMLTGLGFVDVVAVAHSLGAWSSGTLGSQANEFAAMPSLHVAWAVWCTFAVWAVRKDRTSRTVAIGYAALTAVVVMATANHYFLDVVGGFAAAAAAIAFANRVGPEAAVIVTSGRAVDGS